MQQHRSYTQMNNSSRLQIELAAAVIYVTGILAILSVPYSILSNAAIAGPDIADLDTRIWNFLNIVGVLRPIIVLVGGILLIRLGLWIRTMFVGAARWARVALTWSIVVATLGIIQAARIGLDSETVTGEPSGSQFLISTFPWGIILFVLVSGLVLVNRNLHQFRGDEHVTSQRTRNAWNLLAPTLIIFYFIGLGPLEQVFIKSLSNERFASSADNSQFIGLNNYTKLLGVRIDVVPCEKDETSGECLTETDANGERTVIYPSNARRYLSDNVSGYRSTVPFVDESSYRPVGEFSLLGTHYVISARDREFVEAFVTSVIYSAAAISLQLVIGMCIAMLLTARLRGMTIMRVALLVPLAIPTLIATQFWDVMLLPNDAGVANSVLMSLGFIEQPLRWLLDTNLQLPSVILVIVWKETPSMALLLLPGLLSISPEIYQAASVDGANRWQQFWRITLPMMRPTIGVALVLRTMVMLRVFDVFEILLGARRFSMATYTHNVLVSRQELGYSSAVSVAIFFIILFFTVIYMRSLRIDQA